MKNYFKELLQHLSRASSAEHIQLKLYRNYETLPEKLESGDIDISCQPNERKVWRKIFRELGNLDEYSVSMIWTSYYVDKYSVKLENGRQVEFDINYRFEWYNVNWGGMIKNRVLPYNDYIVVYPRPECLFIAFCHNFLYGGKIPHKYAKRYADVITHNDFRFYMDAIFGSYSHILVSAMINEKNKLPPKTITKIRIYVMVKFLIRSYGLDITKIISRYFWGERYTAMCDTHENINVQQP